MQAQRITRHGENPLRPIVLALLMAAAPAAVMAQEAKTDNVYQLGELQVTAHDRHGEELGGSVITGDTLQAFDKQSVDEALSLVPGANESRTGGSRNESVIYVRGFDRFQTTLSIDGIRVFLPADNRIDFGRFLTSDLSEVQVSKGYVSVLDGPGGLGAAINLVTLKPTKALEGSLQGTIYTDQQFQEDAYLLSGRIGGKADKYYWQISGTKTDRDSFGLSRKFKPTTLENGGDRDHSDSNDWRVNAKVGFTPNDTDEYSLNYIKTEGVKNAPYSVTDTTNTRFWTWPYWNTDSIALLTKTQFGSRFTLKSRLYDNGFDNLLSSFDTAAQTTQSTPRAFNSYYRDRADGGNVELDYDVNPTSQLKGVFYVRRDVHNERQDGFVRTPPAPTNPSVNTAYAEPWQKDDELTYSLAGEYSTGLAPNVDLTIGASYDWTDLRQADDINVLVAGTTIANSTITYQPVHYPLRNNSALNGQAALVWRLNDDTRFHFSISDRSRFPTLFERFSSRMGTAVPNPSIREERAINYEIGAETKVLSNTTWSGAVFYSDLDDALLQIPVTVQLIPGDPTSAVLVNQTQNVAKGKFYGVESSLDVKVSDTLTIGGNLTVMQRQFYNNANGGHVQYFNTGVPNAKLFAYAAWKLDKLTIRPSVEADSSRWTVTTAAPATYYKTGDFTLINIAADYALTRNITATVAVKNLFDANYQLTDGFPEAGQSFYASIRARF